MDAITSIMASEFAADLQKFQIQIHGVRIKKDLKTVVVYWSCDESGLIDEEAKAALENIETPVRSRLRLIETTCIFTMRFFPSSNGSCALGVALL